MRLANVVLVALEFFKIVANIYKPRSVNAFGTFTFTPFVEVTNRDFNAFHSIHFHLIQ